MGAQIDGGRPRIWNLWTWRQFFYSIQLARQQKAIIIPWIKASFTYLHHSGLKKRVVRSMITKQWAAIFWRWHSVERQKRKSKKTESTAHKKLSLAWYDFNTFENKRLIKRDTVFENFHIYVSCMSLEILETHHKTNLKAIMMSFEAQKLPITMFKFTFTFFLDFFPKLKPSWSWKNQMIKKGNCSQVKCTHASKCLLQIKIFLFTNCFEDAPHIV